MTTPATPASTPSAATEVPWWKDGRVWLLMSITLLTVVVGWQMKAPCRTHDWNGWDNGQWRHYCYSDVQALHGSRGVDDGHWPYVGSFNEYPPLTGIYMHVMGAITDGSTIEEARTNYLAASAVGFTLLALATTVCLTELVGRERKVLYWALSPAVLVYTLYNWDMLAVAPTIGALLAFRKGHYGLAGALLGLGASAKLYPAFLAPALGMWLIREERGLRRGGLSLGIGFFAVWGAVHLPFLLLDAHGLMEAYRFQAKRSPNFETIWYAIAHLGREWHIASLDRFDDKPIYEIGGTIPFAIALVFSAWAAFTRRLDPVAAAVIPVFAFLAFNKVYSVQYTLWAIPLLIVVPTSRTLKALVVVADLTVFVTLSNYFALWDHAQDGHLFTPAAFAILFRAGVWATCGGLLVRQAMMAPAPAAVHTMEAVA